MLNRKTILFDMDGVLADFDTGYSNIIECNTWNMENFKRFVDKEGFIKLNPLPHGVLSFQEVSKLGSLDVGICSSLTSSKFDLGFFHEVVRQKMVWLRENIDFELVELADKKDIIHFVPEAKFKSIHASSNTFLIDDLYENTSSFINAGGNAFHVTPDFHENKEIIGNLISNLKQFVS
jgi:hypothetical protein